MLSVLLVSVSSTVAIRVSLSAQIYNKLAQNAGDAGLAYAKACLDANSGVPTWTDANPLTPSTDCSGNQLPGFTCPDGTADPRCAVSVNGDATVQVLVVAGGGGGGYFGGGGGAGGLINQNTQVTANSYPVIVGGGGAGAPNPTINATNGNDSSFNSMIAQGGGGGGSRNDAASYYARAGNPGGSGGGSSMGDSGPQQMGGLGVVGQGKNGGNGMIGSYFHGGGGGAGENGSNGASNFGGKGGDGSQSSITGSSLWYAGGGGGGIYISGTVGAGGNGGGGGGGSTTVSPTAGSPNTGGGGGGYGYGPNNGNSGGSGIVIISYPTGSIVATGGTITTSGGNTIHTFTSSGTFDVTSATANSSVVTSTFSVGLPSVVNGKANEINSVGSTSLLRSSDNSVWRRYNQSSRLTIPFTTTPVTAIDSITGATTVGLPLTAGAITPEGATVSYQWQSSATSGGTYTDISGATSSTYTLASGDIGRYIKVVATGTNYYSGSATSTQVGAVTAACPSGFIPVPGSATYSTSNFCVMKYEAKQVGATTTPISQAAGTPWVIISQTTAIANSPNVANCTGCHLITEGEYLTIAQNVLSVPTNWSTGTVGSGFIYSGHNDNAPANALDADTNDSNGYYGTGNVANSNQKRTLTLSNGEVIWDLAGNVWEWTSGTSTTGQPGVTGAGYTWREWTAVTNPGTLSPNPSPTTTGITGASSWNSSNGIGQIYSSADASGLRGFLRGGDWSDGGRHGVLALGLFDAPSVANSTIGFRVSR